MKWFTYKKDVRTKSWMLTSGNATFGLVYFRWAIARELWYYDVVRAGKEPSRIYQWFAMCRERSLVEDDLPLLHITIGPVRLYLGWLG